MPAPYTQQFTMPDGKAITSVVIDEAEFLAFCDELVDLFDPWLGQRTQQEQIAAIKAAQNLPLMSRGTKTQKFFTRWQIKTDLLSVIVRGAGPRVFKDLMAKVEGANGERN